MTVPGCPASPCRAYPRRLAAIPHGASTDAGHFADWYRRNDSRPHSAAIVGGRDSPARERRELDAAPLIDVVEPNGFESLCYAERSSRASAAVRMGRFALDRGVFRCLSFFGRIPAPLESQKCRAEQSA